MAVLATQQWIEYMAKNSINPDQIAENSQIFLRIRPEFDNTSVTVQ